MSNTSELILQLISKVIIFFFCFPVHEFAHAFVADRFGDDTPRRAGRLTLYPPAHWDLMGSLFLLIGSFGWAKPVPINPYLLSRRSRWAEMWVSLAGPLSNLAMAILGAFLIRIITFLTLDASNIIAVIAEILFYFMYINLILAIFNLIPIAPLDGEKVLEPFLPPSAADFMARFRPYGFLVLLLIFFILPYLGYDVLSYIINPLIYLLVKFPF